MIPLVGAFKKYELLEDRFDLYRRLGVLELHHTQEPLEGLAPPSVTAASELVAELRLKLTQAGYKRGS